MGKVTGIVKVMVNGQLQRSKEGASLDLGGMSREPVSGYKLYGAQETFKPSELECTLAHMSDTDLPALNALVDATVRFECDSGTTYLVTNACCAETLKITNGEASLKMFGDPAIEE